MLYGYFCAIFPILSVTRSIQADSHLKTCLKMRAYDIEMRGGDFETLVGMRQVRNAFLGEVVG